MRLVDASAVDSVVYGKVPLKLFMKRTLAGAQKSVGELRDMLDLLPAVEAKRVVHGRWERSPTGYPFCSNCDWCPEEDDMTHGYYKYCPNCSALMENGDEYF